MDETARIYLNQTKAIVTFTVEVLATGFAIGGGMLGLFRVAVLPAIRNYRAMVQGVSRVGAIDAEIAELKRLNQEVLSELRSNGGNSLRDCMESIHRYQIRTRAILERHINESKILTFYCEANGEVSFVSDAYLHFVGRSRNEVLGFNWLNAVAYDMRESTREAWESSMQDERIFEIHHDYVRPDDVRTTAFLRIEPFHDEKKNVIMWIGSIYPKASTPA